MVIRVSIVTSMGRVYCSTVSRRLMDTSTVSSIFALNSSNNGGTVIARHILETPFFVLVVEVEGHATRQPPFPSSALD